MGRKALTTDAWIELAKEIHGDRYDYSETVYTHRQNKLTIICKEHGKFTQWPCSHVAGSGCRECSSDARRTPLEEFVNKSKSLFPGKFTYDKTQYINAHSKVIVTCIKHGDVTMRARKHLSMPHGCAECELEHRRSTTLEFTEKAMLVHGDKYGYEYVDYFKVDVPVTIKCNACGNPFDMKPNTHLRGCGCPRCAKTGFNVGSPISYLYIIPVSGVETFLGFGITSTISGRFKIHKYNLTDSQCYVSGDVVLIKSTGENIYNLERHIKASYNCKQSSVVGFKTESMKETSKADLLQIGVDWLTKEGLEYEVLTHNKE